MDRRSSSWALVMTSPPINVVDINSNVNWAVALLRDPASVARTGAQAPDVWLGDQVKLPRYPAICVEPGPLVRELVGAQRQFATTNDIIIMCYVGRVQDESVNQAQAVDVGQAVVNILHEHAQMGGRAIHSYVQRVEPGYATRANTLLRVCRLTFVTMQEELFPASAP